MNKRMSEEVWYEWKMNWIRMKFEDEFICSIEMRMTDGFIRLSVSSSTVSILIQGLEDNRLKD